MKKYPLKEKGNGVLGIQLKCPKHDWQRTIYIKDGIGCSYCYENRKQKLNHSELDQDKALQDNK